jgi:hypothetical protein
LIADNFPDVQGGYMKRVLTAILLTTAVAGLVYAKSQAAPVWEDNFTSGGNWVTQFGTITSTAVGGIFTVKNTSANIAVLKSDQMQSSFTYSVKLAVVSPTFAYTGILFCWSNNFEGYVFTIAGNKQWALQKMIREGSQTTTTTIKIGTNGFITGSANTLKVSKSGNIITIYCNDVYLGQVDETGAAKKFDSGYIGLVMNAGEEVAYDYAAIWSEPQVIAPLTYYEDSFEANDLNGWFVKQAAGTVEWKNSAMQIGTGSARRQSIVLTNGNYKKGKIKTIATKISGSDSAFYGLIRMDLREDGNFDALVYTINGIRQRAVYWLSTRKPIEYSLISASAINDLPSDTLEVGGPTGYQFWVNEKPIPEINWGTIADTMNFNVVGFIVDSGVTVQFDDFVAGEVPTPVAMPRRLAPTNSSPLYMVGGVGIIYDPMGRKIGEFKNGRMTGENLGKGQYFVMPNRTNGKSVIQRAIIVR